MLTSDVDICGGSDRYHRLQYWLYAKILDAHNGWC
jgi:hypothetical protein